MSIIPSWWLLLRTIWQGNTGFDRVSYLIRAVEWQCRKRLGRPFITRLSNSARVKVYPNSAYSNIFYYRWFERKDTIFFRKYSHLANTFVDVGANVGLFSANLFDRFERFLLIEPGRPAVSALRELCQLNPNISCTVLPLAISSEVGSVPFTDDGDYSTTGRIFDGRRALPSGAVVRPVPSDTLDNVLREIRDDIVMKVDVEGLEERVFEGARGLFDNQRVKLVMFERLEMTNIERISNFFASRSYVMFYVTESGEISQRDSDLRRPMVNLFACPQDVFTEIRTCSQMTHY